ncbi:glucose-6-phosphate dehydrogenase [Rubellicoccus peritrichatus]|uniref:Glucose-6-phosphate 1-dehydrogenase n=1 Tax=Rubellicoccus peritrichatus TaxID=3080537 RepID=A0AAQ3LAV7_9BACT|nr:glucose-6-phosphate dehydrogenase [Puniceicoccus sp. CR14]WOO42749.1 glucose-6-phosphate dehydrogenase [Puniceicoccus sp. CR14]
MSDTARHPFLEGLSKHRGAPPTVIVIFGASGDLTSRKLVPALYNLGLDSLLPSEFHLLGYGRKPIPDEEFQANCERDLEKFSRRPLNKDIWGHVKPNVGYHAGGYDDPKAFTELKERMLKIEKEAGRDLQFLFYISTPPSVFKPILENLGSSGLARHHDGTDLASKVIIEKPFGRDLDTAKELNRIITDQFHEHQVYRIDHYLGKETVQDLLVLRFANSIFEPLWNRNYVDCVQITVAESLGVGTRGGYYDQSGATRDMLQNHTMQLLALTAMEAPVSLGAEAIRDEKVKLLKAIQPLRLEGENCDAVRAQYGEGLIDGVRAPGYMQEQDIPQDSSTETYGALRFSIDNWRWQGVPFYLRSGKRLARRVSEIAIRFKQPPGILFSDPTRFDLANNTLVIQIQPDEGTTLLMNSKIPGLETRTQAVKMHFRYATTFGSNTPEAYERLILDCMIGDSTLFIRGDETETSWGLYTPLLESWQELGRKGLQSYPCGSWGPLAADKLLWQSNHEWRRAGP